MEDLIKQIIENKVEFNKAPWEEISLSAKDLILRCLTTDPKQRITPTDALMHPWIVCEFQITSIKKKKLKIIVNFLRLILAPT